MAPTMRCARLHAVDTPFRLEKIPVPEPGPGDVLVAVKACSIVPNMRNIVRGGHWRILPELPAVFGLDTAGEVAALGPGVDGWRVGERVYVNPALSCGVCDYCRTGAAPLNCDVGALQGYFGFRPGSEATLARHPIGGFAEYMTAPARNLVRLPDAVSDEVGARFGYLGTAYAALLAAGARAGDAVAVIGATGTLGVNATLFALALGLGRILPIARNPDRLARLKALAPDRIFPIPIDGAPVAERMQAATNGIGPALMLDCLAAGALSETTANALTGLRRGGIAVNIGALNDPLTIEPMRMMFTAGHYRGSNWFTVAEGEAMAELIRSGVLDASVFEHRVYPLEEVNDALADAGRNNGGFVNIVVKP